MCRMLARCKSADRLAPSGGLQSRGIASVFGRTSFGGCFRLRLHTIDDENVCFIQHIVGEAVRATTCRTVVSEAPLEIAGLSQPAAYQTAKFCFRFSARFAILRNNFRSSSDVLRSIGGVAQLICALRSNLHNPRRDAVPTV